MFRNNQSSRIRRRGKKMLGSSSMIPNFRSILSCQGVLVSLNLSALPISQMKGSQSLSGNSGRGCLRSKTHEDTLDASVCQFCRSLLLSHLHLNQSRIFAMTLTGHSTTELDGFEPSHLACRTGCGKRNSDKG